MSRIVSDELWHEMCSALWQYESDLKHPPTGDSIKRRLERVERVIALADKVQPQ